MEHFDSLPLDISIHIFSLLPIDSASDCALVSKSWKNFIHSLPFYLMHASRLIHLLGEKRKEVEECLKAARQFQQDFQSIDLAENLGEQRVAILKESLEDKLNSAKLAVEKLNNSRRLAAKFVQICKEYIELGKSPFEASGRRDQPTAYTLDLGLPVVGSSSAPTLKPKPRAPPKSDTGGKTSSGLPVQHRTPFIAGSTNITRGRDGTSAGRGGASAVRGGSVVARGGASVARGGSVVARGGASVTTGGSVVARGGASVATGGSVVARGGASAARGGSISHQS